MRGNGERIGPQNLPTSSIAGGIWNLLNQQRAQQRGAWPSATPAVVTDPYFMYVPLLLNTTSTNGQQNNTFLDSSTNNFTITRNGTPTQGSFTPYQPSGYWSGYFSSSYLSVADSASLRFGSGNFTIEAWVFRTASGATHTIACKGASTPTGWVFQISSANKLVFIDTSTSITGSTNILANTWTYVAVVRAGTGASQTTLYVNGTSDGTGTSGTTFNQTDAMRIATDRSAANSFAGYISNLRLSNTNLSISNQTAPLSVIGSTIFYSLGYNRFIDGSTLASAITVGSGTPQVQAFQPFSPAASYSAATYGGSGYFNGTGDYLDVANNAAFQFGTGDFTIEFWINTRDTDFNICGLTTGSTGNWATVVVSSQFYWQTSYGVTNLFNVSAASILNGAWHHVAITRTGTSNRLFFDGVAQGSSPYADSVNYNGSGTLRVGSGVNGDLNGYLSNLRIVKGTAIYTAAFTPPTLPVTAVSGTSLLTNFGNAGIYDAAWQNNALTVGDAQTSISQYKWSPTSMRFDGTVDALSIPSSTSFGLGTGDWTIEFWLYLNATTTQTILSMLTAAGSTAPHIYYSSGAGIRYYTASADRITGSALSTATWYYIAVTKASGSTRMYINGTQTGSTYTDANNYGTSNPFFVGDYGVPLTGSLTLNGYVQDVRITKGVARTITTPTAAFPTR